MMPREHRNESTLTHEAADWHARLRSESLSEVEEARFRAWLSGDPARRREFDALSALWDKLEGVARSPEILAERRAIAKAAPAGRVSRRAVLGWALAAGVAGAAGFVSWRRTLATETYATGVGELRTVPLSDGSIITLNTSSRVSVQISASQRRIELLQGQAQFEVARDTRPFMVGAGQGEVLALGTVFDVYRRASDVVVTLIEGRVSVTPAAADDAIFLTAGEQLVLGRAAPVRSRADLQQVSAWRSRKLIFADTPLAEAIAEANRYAPVKIELHAPHLAQARVSGAFEAGRNESLAEALQSYFDLEAERRGQALIVLAQKPR